MALTDLQFDPGKATRANNATMDLFAREIYHKASQEASRLWSRTPSYMATDLIASAQYISRIDLIGQAKEKAPGVVATPIRETVFDTRLLNALSYHDAIQYDRGDKVQWVSDLTSDIRREIYRSVAIHHDKVLLNALLETTVTTRTRADSGNRMNITTANGTAKFNPKNTVFILDHDGKIRVGEDNDEFTTSIVEGGETSIKEDSEFIHKSFLRAKEHLSMNNVDVSTSPPCMPATPSVIALLQRTEYFINNDYFRKTIESPEAGTFMYAGIKFIKVTPQVAPVATDYLPQGLVVVTDGKRVSLENSGADYKTGNPSTGQTKLLKNANSNATTAAEQRGRINSSIEVLPLYTEDCYRIGYNYSKDEADLTMEKLPYLSYATQLYWIYRIGAVRMDEDKVVRVVIPKLQ